jgi:hypothetical protein
MGYLDVTFISSCALPGNICNNRDNLSIFHTASLEAFDWICLVQHQTLLLLFCFCAITIDYVGALCCIFDSSMLHAPVEAQQSNSLAVKTS